MALGAIISLSFAACNKADKKAETHHDEVTDESGEALPVSNDEQSADTTAQVDTNATAHMHYYCPMKCEGEKVYNEDVPCPTCGMKLKTIEHEGH